MPILAHCITGKVRVKEAKEYDRICSDFCMNLSVCRDIMEANATTVLAHCSPHSNFGGLNRSPELTIEQEEESMGNTGITSRLEWQ